MATTTTRSDVFTYDDFCVRVKDGEKADLIDGVIYMASPENLRANDLFGWLYSLMRLYVRKRQLGRIYGSRVACRLDDMNAPEPDILFVSSRHASRLKRNAVEGAPDCALEVVSPESVERDYIKKRIQYERFGVPEYWIIDEFEQKVILLRLDSHGKYREVRAKKGVFHSQVIEGFWLDPQWLWQQPLPDELETLQQLLSK